MLRTITNGAIAALAALALSGLWANAAGAQPAGVRAVDHPEIGRHLVNANGITIYFNDRDGAAAPSCTGDCAENWPPFAPAAAEAAAGNFSIIERKDGLQQWAYQNVPMYMFHEDEALGDIKGNLVRNDWRAFRPCFGMQPCAEFDLPGG